MSNAKIIEAEDNIKQAEKYLKTSLFKWNPDYDSAGDAYSRAATAYKVGGNKQKAIECLDKACECYKHMRTLFQAARVLDQARPPRQSLEAELLQDLLREQQQEAASLLL